MTWESATCENRAVWEPTGCKHCRLTFQQSKRHHQPTRIKPKAYLSCLRGATSLTIVGSESQGAAGQEGGGSQVQKQKIDTAVANWSEDDD